MDLMAVESGRPVT
uniref:Uncharacterized protein n=1 Tax=Moniliophthora roreri TaxID=221103 RepID=A0A0W0GEU9_MONRR